MKEINKTTKPDGLDETTTTHLSKIAMAMGLSGDGSRTKLIAAIRKARAEKKSS